MDIIWIFISLLIGYLAGSISFGRLVTRMMKPNETLDDVEMPIPGVEETYKLKSIGGNTASMKLGARGGCLVGLLDILKAFFPTLIFRLIFPGEPYFFFAAFGAFVGHNWPIYHRFKGGRGISPFYGGLLAIDPVGGFVVAFTALLLGMVVIKELMFAYVGGVILIIPWFLITKNNEDLFLYYMTYAIAINILFIVAMLPEIKQIVELRRKYGKGDIQASMDTFPMGRHMLKLMNRLGLSRKGQE